ncbi:MAG TPA: efflux transporter outer membrane subunit [Thermoanaerobaculia bacterium]|nr:efflux transporter outer membrane subunit [Thermoanaerobaculia bacterium]
MNDGARAAVAAVLTLAALAAGSCVVGPDFKRPAPPGVDGYLPPAEAANGANPANPLNPASTASVGEAVAQRVALGEQVPAAWWGLFHCARLDETLRQAIAASNSLAAARATLAQAREAVVEARAGLYPQLDLGAGARHASGGAGGAGGGGNLFSIGPNASYAIDAFGGTRRRVEQETALAENQRFQLAAAYLTLTGNSVTAAIAIASTRLQIATVEDLIKNDQKNLALVQRELDAGKVARSEVLTAAAQLESDRTQLPGLHQQLSVARHALAVLAGRAPAAWSPPEFDIAEFTLPDNLPLSLPSELVRRRPDILAAEAQLHADSAAIGVATAQLYPSITLSASLVQESAALARLLEAAGRAWTVGGSLDAPLYRGGALGAARRAAVDAYDAQLATYRQTVLQAFGQVADALCALEHDAELVAASRRALDIAGASLALQRSSYAAGKTSALQLIVAENTYSDARLGNARATAQRLADTAQLFIAAGGSWWDDAAPAPGPPSPAAGPPQPR